MKVVVENNDNVPRKKELLLPLEEDMEEHVLDKSNSTLWELSTRPGTAGAATYKYQVRTLTGTENPRQILRWRDDVIKVCVGLNVTTLQN